MVILAQWGASRADLGGGAVGSDRRPPAPSVVAVGPRTVFEEPVVPARRRRGLPTPVLAVVANADGIVPAATARSIEGVLGTEHVDVLEVGDDKRWYAHADLFIGKAAHEEVFDPIDRWLRETVH